MINIKILTMCDCLIVYSQLYQSRHPCKADTSLRQTVAGLFQPNFTLQSVSDITPYKADISLRQLVPRVSMFERVRVLSNTIKS